MRGYTMVGCVEVAVPGKWGYRCKPLEVGSRIAFRAQFLFAKTRPSSQTSA